MEWPDVSRRIQAGEGLRTEFKRGLDLATVGKTVCAFANADGGAVILGVNDAGTVVGVSEDPDSVQERLTGFLQSGCSAPVGASCGRHRHPDGWVHWIETPRIRGFDPLRYRGRFYIRRGRSSVEPSPNELQELFNVFGFVFTEEQVILAAGVEDIDIHAFRSFLRRRGIETEEEPQPSIEDDLRNARVLRAADGTLRPTLYGLMAFGRDPQAHPHTGSFWIQCIAYAGHDRASDVILAGEGKGRLDEQVRRALGWLKGLGWTESYTGILREDRPLVPGPAVREALVNAVAHRDYALVGSPVQLEVFRDRVAVTSPGTLPNHMTVENVRFGGLPRSRNEWMANAMVVARLMEKRGLGWLRMRREMQAFNGTEPELANDEGGKFVRVTFRLKPEPAGEEA